MEVVKCSRCGAFYTSNGYVCPKCTNKDNLELATFKNFVEENGVELKSRKFDTFEIKKFM